MSPDSLSILATLHPQPLRFEAGVRLSDLHAKALALLQASAAKREAVRMILDIDLGALTDASQHEAIQLSARAAVQSSVSSGKLTLNVFSPLTGRYFALPQDALLSPFRFHTALEGQDIPAAVQHIGETIWVSGVLTENETSGAIAPLARDNLPVYVSQVQSEAVLETLKRLTDRRVDRPQMQPAQGADASDEIAKTIRRLAAERTDGLLPLAEGVHLLRDLYPHLKRDEARARIRATLGARPQGRPRGPMKTAKKSAV